MVDGEIEEGNEAAMRSWSAWHMVRILLVDAACAVVFRRGRR